MNLIADNIEDLWLNLGPTFHDTMEKLVELKREVYRRKLEVVLQNKETTTTTIPENLAAATNVEVRRPGEPVEGEIVMIDDDND